MQVIKASDNNNQQLDKVNQPIVDENNHNDNQITCLEHNMYGPTIKTAHGLIKIYIDQAYGGYCNRQCYISCNTW